jgi:hypothetical protein
MHPHVIARRTSRVTVGTSKKKVGAMRDAEDIAEQTTAAFRSGSRNGRPAPA